MNRRTFLCGLTLGTLDVALAVEAQQKMARVGMLRSTTEPPEFGNMTLNLQMFRDGLRDHGYVEGRNLAIEFRYPRTRSEPLEDLVANLLSLKVDLIHAAGPPAVLAARRVTATIPIVAHDFETDPVKAGLITSFARPGGNVTGMFLDLPELIGKHLEFLRTTVPRLSRVAVFWDPSIGDAQVQAAQRSARELTLSVSILEVHDIAGFEPAFQLAVKQHAQALLVLSSPLFGPSQRVAGGVTASQRIGELAIRHRLPSIAFFTTFAEAGGLLAYGPNIPELYRQEARVVAKILDGIAAAELPIERPIKFELVVNLKAASALRLSVPPSVLGRADQVIE